MSEPMYYIQCKSHYAWDYVLWWGKNRSGYTYDIDDAGLYTQEEALQQERERPDVDVAWRADDVRKSLRRSSDIGRLRAAKKDRELVEYVKTLLPMTPEQREAQRRSFAYGNASISNPDITIEMIDEAAERMKAEC